MQKTMANTAGSMVDTLGSEKPELASAEKKEGVGKASTFSEPFISIV